MKTITEITIYEIDGETQEGLSMPKMDIESHWNRSNLVVLSVPGIGKKMAVLAQELKMAIDNAINVKR